MAAETNRSGGADGYWSWAYALLCICNLLIFFSFQMLLPTLPVYVIARGGDASSVGLVVAVVTLAAVAIRPFAGYALDRGNRRFVVVAGSIAFAAAAGAFPVSSAPGWTIVCAALLGVGWGTLTAAYATLVSGLIPEGRQGAGIGTFMLFGMFSMAVGPFFGGWVYGAYGDRALFGAAFLVALLSLLLFPAVRIGGRKAGTVSGGSATSNAGGARFVERSAIFPAFLILLFTIGYGGVLSFASLFGQSLGVANGGMFFLIASIASMTVRPAAGKLFDAKGPATVLLPGIAIGVASLAWLSAAATPWMYFAASALFGLSFGAVQPYMLAWTVRRARPERQGAANGTFLIGFDAGIALGSITLGLWSGTLGIAGTFRASAAALTLMLIVYAVSVAAEKRARTRPVAEGRQ